MNGKKDNKEKNKNKQRFGDKFMRANIFIYVALKPTSHERTF